MIFADGKVYPSEEQDRILQSLEEKINQTRERNRLLTETVIRAFDQLCHEIVEGQWNGLLKELKVDIPMPVIKAALPMMQREGLEYKIKVELGEDFFSEMTTVPPSGGEKLFSRPVPLGTLFHIAAGNMEALPAYSVAEGLLTGNINILKLPQADQGLTLKIFRRLIEIEPDLAEYVYIFDTPSADIPAMKRMAEMADAVVVWGGDEAVASVRRLASPGTKIIEWGHRLGFAYISGFPEGGYDREAEYSALAEHIMDTKQLLCSSCQTIYLDTEDKEKLHQFCREFLPYLEKAAGKFPNAEIGPIAELTLRRHYQSLEKIIYGNLQKQQDRKVYQGEHCSLTACGDMELELSNMYGNCLVKRLPKREMMSVLRRRKGYLQTTGLICEDGVRQEMTNLLIRCGISRVMSAGHMSHTFYGEAHDGEYPLRRYTRIVNVEKLG